MEIVSDWRRFYNILTCSVKSVYIFFTSYHTNMKTINAMNWFLFLIIASRSSFQKSMFSFSSCELGNNFMSAQRNTFTTSSKELLTFKHTYLSGLRRNISILTWLNFFFCKSLHELGNLWETLMTCMTRTVHGYLSIYNLVRACA